jgi:hypothetical protein
LTKYYFYGSIFILSTKNLSLYMPEYTSSQPGMEHRLAAQGGGDQAERLEFTYGEWSAMDVPPPPVPGMIIRDIPNAGAFNTIDDWITHGLVPDLPISQEPRSVSHSIKHAERKLRVGQSFTNFRVEFIEPDPSRVNGLGQLGDGSPTVSAAFMADGRSTAGRIPNAVIALRIYGVREKGEGLVVAVRTDTIRSSAWEALRKQSVQTAAMAGALAVGRSYGAGVPGSH